jgi:hypothetical protein
MALITSDHEIIIGEDNLLDVDLSTDLDPGDEVWYTAKYSRSDTDASAAIKKKRSTAGIVDVDTATGKCQVKILRADTLALTGRALLYDVKVKKQDQSNVQTVGTGVAFLLNSVNKDAA